MSFTVEIYSKNYRDDRGSDGSLLRTLQYASNITVTERLDRTSRIEFQLPRASVDTATIADNNAIEIGRVVVIKDGTATIAKGIVTGPLDKSQSQFKVTARGVSDILNRQITPWDFIVPGSDAAEQVENLLKEYRFFRHNTDDDFNTGSDIEILTVAGPPDQYYIVLRQNTDETYATNGVTTSPPILCADDFLGDPNDVTAFRYLADLGNATRIFVRFRYSNDAATTAPGSVGNWSSWSASTWESSYELESDKNITSRVGITNYSPSGAFRWLQLQIRLETDDTEITPALQAYEVICEYDGEITAGDIDFDGPRTERPFSYVSAWEAIRTIAAERNAEFRAQDDYTLDVTRRFGVTTPTQTLTANTGCNVVRLQQQDDHLSTEMWILDGETQGLLQPLERETDNTAAETYGIRPWVYTPANAAGTERTQEIDDELNERKAVTYDVVLEELSDSPITAAVGDYITFVYTERGINAPMRVVAIRHYGTSVKRQFELVSDAGHFVTGYQIPTDDEAEDGEDALGFEYIYAITATDDPIPDAKLPSNDWGFAEPETIDGLEWHRLLPDLTDDNPYLFRAEREVAGMPSEGDAVSAEWSTPALFSRLAIADVTIDNIEWEIPDNEQSSDNAEITFDVTANFLRNGESQTIDLPANSFTAVGIAGATVTHDALDDASTATLSVTIPADRKGSVYLQLDKDTATDPNDYPAEILYSPTIPVDTTAELVIPDSSIIDGILWTIPDGEQSADNTAVTFDVTASFRRNGQSQNINLSENAFSVDGIAGATVTNTAIDDAATVTLSVMIPADRKGLAYLQLDRGASTEPDDYPTSTLYSPSIPVDTQAVPEAETQDIDGISWTIPDNEQTTDNAELTFDVTANFQRNGASQEIDLPANSFSADGIAGATVTHTEIDNANSATLTVTIPADRKGLVYLLLDTGEATDPADYPVETQFSPSIPIDTEAEPEAETPDTDGIVWTIPDNEQASDDAELTFEVTADFQRNGQSQDIDLPANSFSVDGITGATATHDALDDASTVTLSVTIPADSKGNVYLQLDTGDATDPSDYPLETLYSPAIPVNTEAEPEDDTDYLQWGYFQEIDVFASPDGSHSGVIASEIDDNLDNPSGADVTITVASKSANITSATINADNDLSIGFTGLVANASGHVVVQADATIDGTDRTVQRTININLIFQSGAAAASVADSKAESAAELAEDASEAASTADSKAEDASSAASNADSKAENASSAASQADSKATNASNAASSASSAASAASSAASAADSKATAASTAASTADSKAVSAGGRATAASTAAATASQAASTADSKATAASQAASTADSKAVSAGLAASVADSKAVSAGTRVTAASNAAANASQAASVADSKAENASQAASTADSKAVSAAGVANTASTAAANADSKAVSAGLVASTADSKAVSAGLAASVADSQAVSAGAAVSTADSKAVSAGGVASTADSKATDASNAASNADSKAVSAGVVAAGISQAASTADSKATDASTAASTADSKAVSAGIRANAASTAASVADSKAVSAGGVANSANNAAITASNAASNADSKAVSAGARATAASNAAVSADSKAVSAGVKATAASTAAATADNKAVSAGARATAASTAAATADSKAVSAGALANTASTAANSASQAAVSADNKAVSAGAVANSASQAAVSADNKAVSAGVVANSASQAAANASQAASTADSKAVSAGAVANSASQAAVSADSKAVSAGAVAATAKTDASTADSKAVSAGGVAAGATTDASTADSKAVSAGAVANSASNAASTSDSKAVSAGAVAAGAVTAASTADSKAVSAGLAASTADSKATVFSTDISAADSKAVSAGLAASVADSNAGAVSLAASTADSKAVSNATSIDTISNAASNAGSTASSNATSLADVSNAAATADSKAESIAESLADNPFVEIGLELFNEVRRMEWDVRAVLGTRQPYFDFVFNVNDQTVVINQNALALQIQAILDRLDTLEG